MEKSGISKVIKNFIRMISKNSPIILTSLAVGGLVTTVIFAVKATPKAVELIKADSRDAHDGDPYGYTHKEAIKSAWKVYIPTTCMGVLTVACIIGSHSINQRRNAALATVYSLTEKAFKEYSEKVIETVGKNKELKIRDDISADKIKQNPPGETEVIFTGKGEVLCYDSLSGRYFKSDIEHIRRTINDLNKNLLSDMFLSVNDLYYAIGLANTKLGEELGWDVDRGLLEVSFSSHLTESGEPCLVLNYDVMPKFYNA